MKLENIQIWILSILGYKIQDINIKQSIELAANLAKKSHLISVDITELFFDKVNFIGFFLEILDFIFLFIYLIFLILVCVNDSLYNLVDNGFLPKNFKVILIGLIFAYSFSICIRFDLMTAEWNGKLGFLKIIYFIQENIKTKHGLTDRNFEKLTV